MIKLNRIIIFIVLLFNLLGVITFAADYHVDIQYFDITTYPDAYGNMQVKFRVDTNGESNIKYDVYLYPNGDQSKAVNILSEKGKRKKDIELDLNISNFASGDYQLLIYVWFEKKGEIISSTRSTNNFYYYNHWYEEQNQNESNNQEEVVEEVKINEETIEKLNVEYENDSRTVNVSWDDILSASIDEVVVEFYNDNTDELIDSQVVTTDVKQITYSFSEGIENIRVEVKTLMDEVESEATVRVINTLRENAINIIYPFSKLSNNSTLKLTYTNGYSGTIKVGINDNQRNEQIQEEGEIEISLSEGNNEIVIKTEENNVWYVESFNYVLDTKAPSLSIDQSLKGLKTKDKKLEISGKTETDAVLKINNKVINLNEDGTFSHVINLEEGVNQISVISTDVAGNIKEYNVKVDRVAATSKIKILLLLIIVVLGVMYYFNIFNFKDKVNKTLAKLKESSSEIFDKSTKYIKNKTNVLLDKSKNIVHNVQEKVENDSTKVKKESQNIVNNKGTDVSNFYSYREDITINQIYDNEHKIDFAYEVMQNELFQKIYRPYR